MGSAKTKERETKFKNCLFLHGKGVGSVVLDFDIYKILNLMEK